MKRDKYFRIATELMTVVLLLVTFPLLVCGQERSAQPQGTGCAEKRSSLKKLEAQLRDGRQWWQATTQIVSGNKMRGAGDWVRLR